jgi:hypothetical protein
MKLKSLVAALLAVMPASAYAQGTPGGSNGQIQFNNAGSFGGFTVGGDATLNTATGALSISSGAVTAAKMASGAAVANGALSPTGSGAGLTGITANQIGSGTFPGSYTVIGNVTAANLISPGGLTMQRSSNATDQKIAAILTDGVGEVIVAFPNDADTSILASAVFRRDGSLIATNLISAGGLTITNASNPINQKLVSLLTDESGNFIIGFPNDIDTALLSSVTLSRSGALTGVTLPVASLSDRTSYFPGLTTNVQSFGLGPGLDMTNAGWFFLNSQTVVPTAQKPTLRVDRQASYAGGTGVQSGLWVLNTVSAGVTDFEWTGLFQLVSNATNTSVNNVALVASAEKHGASSTWGQNIILNDFLANQTTASIASEVDLLAVGSDTNKTRVIMELAAACSGPVLTANPGCNNPEVTFGLRIGQAFGLGALIRHAVYLNPATYTDLIKSDPGAIYTTGIDLTQGTCGAGGAFQGPNGSSVDCFGSVATGTATVSALPNCNTAAKGKRHFVTDASASAFASTVAGGGSTNVPVTCNGTNWIIGELENETKHVRRFAADDNRRFGAEHAAA